MLLISPKHWTGPEIELSLVIITGGPVYLKVSKPGSYSWLHRYSARRYISMRIFFIKIPKAEFKKYLEYLFLKNHAEARFSDTKNIFTKFKRSKPKCMKIYYFCGIHLHWHFWCYSTKETEERLAAE